MAIRARSTIAKPRALIVAGVMSGTSADGVDVAFCRISPARAAGSSPQIKFLAHAGFPYPRAVRAELLRIMESAPTTAADLSRLNWRLGALYADCVEKAARKFSLKPALIGLHGQTIHHETTPHKFLGAPVRSTWQLGEAAVLAERLRCPVVSDLRPADLAAGGQGAPLVPMLDYTLFRHAMRNRILLNLGGIANLTVIPAGAALDSKTNSLLAFDTGPGNMVIDASMMALYSKKYDRNGSIARTGRYISSVVYKLMREPYFAELPPKSCGREQFGRAYANRVIKLCRAAGATDADCIATATGLTIVSLMDSYCRFTLPWIKKHARTADSTEMIVAGGGTRNAYLMERIRNVFRTYGVNVIIADSLGIPSQAKESVAFALLAWLTHFGLPGNVPAATGASHPVVLGKTSWGKVSRG